MNGLGFLKDSNSVGEEEVESIVTRALFNLSVDRMDQMMEVERVTKKKHVSSCPPPLPRAVPLCVCIWAVGCVSGALRPPLAALRASERPAAG